MFWLLTLTLLATAVLLLPVLLFCGWLVRETGSSRSLRDFAVVLRAVPWPRVRITIRRRDKNDKDRGS